MGYISHPKVISSWMLGFLPCHGKWGEVLSNALCIFHLWNSADISVAQHYLFACWLISRMQDLIMLWTLMLCISFFPLSHDASPPVVSMEIFNSSTIKFVTYVEFSKAPYSSTLTRLHGCFSFFSFVRMKRMMRTGARFDAVGNINRIVHRQQWAWKWIHG